MTDDKQTGVLQAMGMGVAGANSADPEAWAKGLYARTLSQWVLDQMHARAHGLLVPSPRRGEGVLGLPFAGGAGEEMPFGFDLAAMLRWKGGQKRAA